MLRTKPPHNSPKLHLKSSHTKSLKKARHASPHSQNTASFFTNVPKGPADPILGITQAYLRDTHPDKINVGVGAYRDDNGKPWVLPSVSAAERMIIASGQNMEYLPIEGNVKFLEQANNLIFGKRASSLPLASIQTISGTGALRCLAGLLVRYPILQTNDPSAPHVVVSDPTWATHNTIFEHAGMRVGKYRYWDDASKGIDFDGLMQDLDKFAPGTCVIFHTCAHNPTGSDPSPQQWAQLAHLVKEKQLFPIFDTAYVGYASGSVEQDVRSIDTFLENGVKNLAVTQSFSKNFGLYGHRAGSLSILCDDLEEQDRVLSQLKIVARGLWSNPPLHGARIVETILTTPELTEQWHHDVQTMSNRILDMRKALRSELVRAGSKHNWDHITNQIGMFCYTGLKPSQTKRLTDEFHIYLSSHRISMAGVTPDNVKRLAHAIHTVTKDE